MQNKIAIADFMVREFCIYRDTDGKHKPNHNAPPLLHSHTLITDYFTFYNYSAAKIDILLLSAIQNRYLILELRVFIMNWKFRQN